MKKNVTIKIDDRLLRQSRHAAIEEDKSLSEWVSGLINQAVMQKSSVATARKSALSFLEKGLDLGGKALTREQAHER